MKQFYFLLSVLFLVNTNAQTWQWARAESANGVGMSTCNDATGDLYFTGYTTGSAVIGTTTISGASAYIIKYDASGTIQWVKSIGGAKGMSIASDNSSNIYVTGTYTGNLTAGSFTSASAGIIDIFTAKFDSQGNQLWVKCAGGSNGDYSSGVCTDASGNCYITGYTGSSSLAFGSTVFTNSNAPVSAFYITKYNSSGTAIWCSGSTSGFIIPNDASADPSGNIYVAGFATSTLALGSTTVGNNGNLDAVMLKYDTNGSLLFANNYGNSNADAANSVNADACGNVFLSGYFGGNTIAFGTVTANNYTNTGSSDAFITKFNSSGNALWTRSVGNTGTEIGYSAVSDGGHVFMCGGQTSPTMQIGTATLTTPFANDCSFLVQYDYSGTIVNAFGVSGGGNSQMDLTLDKSYNLYMGGDFANTFTLGANTLSVTGNESPFTARFSTTILTVGGGTTICEGQSATLTASGTPTIVWANGPTTASYVVSPSVTTQYTVVGSVVLGCPNAVQVIPGYQTVSVNPLPALSVALSATSICTGSSASLTAASAYSCTWNSGSVYLATVVVSPSVTTTYTCELAGQGGCIASKVYTVEVIDCTALDEMNQTAGILLFPNPVLNKLTVKLTGNLKVNVSVMNLSGEKLWSENVSDDMIFIDTTGWPKGVYFMRIEGDAIQKSIKIIRE